MTIKKQFEKIKDNWLIVLLVAVLMIVSFGGNLANITTQSMNKMISYDGVSGMYEDSYKTNYIPGSDSDFAPEITERKVVKTANLQNEVERNEFENSYKNFKNILESYDAYLLTDNVNEYGQGLKMYHSGSFNIKVAVKDYDSLTTELKNIGEVKNFYENSQDVTGSYTDITVELKVEKARLERFNDLLAKSTDVKDQIELTDRIFNQERTVSYYEDRLKNIDQKIDYSTINFSLIEKQSSYANIALVKISELIKTFVESFNALLYMLFFITPWALIILAVRFLLKITKK